MGRTGPRVNEASGTPSIVSIVIPAYREEKSVGQVVEGVRAVMRDRPGGHEILVVDDGSPDGTAASAAKAGAQVIAHPYNRGYGAALKTGIRAAKGDIVAILDSDGQHDPAYLIALLERARTHDMVVGARPNMSGSPTWRKPGKWVLGFMASSLTGRKIPDLNSGFRTFRRAAITRLLPIMPDGFSFSTTSTIAMMRCGYTVAYEPITIQNRHGSSTMTAADGFKALMLVVRIMTLFSPLRVFLPISLVTFLVGLGFVVLGYLQDGAASLRGIVVILASILIFLFGILVDQVSAIRRGESIS